MQKQSLANSLEVITGYFAWAIVCYAVLSSHASAGSASKATLAILILCLLLFIAGFFVATREKSFARMNTEVRQFGILLQMVALAVIRTQNESTAVPFLGVAVAAVLPLWFSRPYAYLGVIILIVSNYFFNSIYWQVDGALMRTAMAGAFYLFGLRMTQRLIQEQEARDEITLLNRELIATQALLSESTKQSERLRISRDLHDGLGHQLTALILKLQYLTLTTKGADHTHATEAHTMAKDLLTDVRATVHEMREGSNIGLRDALDALIAQIPRLSISLNIQPDLQVHSAAKANTLFRCVQEAITNTLKHGNASQMSIQLRQVGNEFDLEVADNGHNQCGFKEGNGLKGMRERIEGLRGRLEISTTQGFGLSIRIPVAESL